MTSLWLPRDLGCQCSGVRGLASPLSRQARAPASEPSIMLAYHGDAKSRRCLSNAGDVKARQPEHDRDAEAAPDTNRRRPSARTRGQPTRPPRLCPPRALPGPKALQISGRPRGTTRGFGAVLGLANLRPQVRRVNQLSGSLATATLAWSGSSGPRLVNPPVTWRPEAGSRFSRDPEGSATCLASESVHYLRRRNLGVRPPAGVSS